MSHIDVIIGGGGSGIGLAFGGAGGVWRCLVIFWSKETFKCRKIEKSVIMTS